jgi:hypothetical protein
MPDNPQTLEQHLAAVAKEYSQYVAAEPIDIDGVRAFNPGHPVPVSHVEGGLVDKAQVKSTRSKDAETPSPVVGATDVPKKG